MKVCTILPKSSMIFVIYIKFLKFTIHSCYYKMRRVEISEGRRWDDFSLSSLVSFEEEFWRSRRSLSHSRFAHCLQSDESSHWRERASAFFLSISLPWSHFIPFFRVPAIVPSFLLYGIKYQAAGHNVPLSFWVLFISFFLRRTPPTRFLRNLCNLSSALLAPPMQGRLLASAIALYLSNARLKILFRLIRCGRNIVFNRIKFACS